MSAFIVHFPVLSSRAPSIPSISKRASFISSPTRIPRAPNSATCCESNFNSLPQDLPTSFPTFNSAGHTDLFPNQCPDTRENIAQQPPAGGGVSDTGDGGGDDDGDNSLTLLRQFGRGDEVLPADLQSLPASQLAAYLKATRNGIVRWMTQIWPGWRRRVAADPDFPFKVLMEETVGLGLAASGMIAARGKNILNELDFAFCDIAVGGTLNFILVYLLTPAVVVGGGAAAQRGMIGSLGQVMKRLPANVFSKGGYSIGERVGGYLYKGGLFAVCGFGGSLLGTSLSQVLVLVRRTVAKARGGGEATVVEKKLPNVAVNSLAWAGFMFVSSNPRYQTVAGVERVLFRFAPEAVAKAGSGALRTANNVIGGAHWVWWARAIGLQKIAENTVDD